MTPGAKVTAGVYAAIVVWDLICPPGQTVSETIARWLTNNYARYPLAALILVTVGHVFALARSYETTPKSDSYERFSALRNIGFPA